jgi:acetylornithine/succinyldiaminopimelate/putrescine aminotransferase
MCSCCAFSSARSVCGGGARGGLPAAATVCAGAPTHNTVAAELNHEPSHHTHSTFGGNHAAAACPPSAIAVTTVVQFCFSTLGWIMSLRDFVL